MERLNLTIRQGSAYLNRRSACHARGEAQLRGHIALVQCHYNFLRPHRALRFGRETRTPAMQAGLMTARLTWGDIFAGGRPAIVVVLLIVDIAVTMSRETSDPAAVPARYSASAQQMAA